jgi:nicotinate-nucleotide adenylyltransferase
MAHASCSGMARIGLLGGSFNPAHNGHRHISLAAMDALGLDQLWWLVSPGNPLKEGAKDMAPFEARMKSARKTAKGTRIRVSDFEQRRGTRYTVDTVRELKSVYPKHDFIWLLGSDTLPNFHKWRDWRGLALEVPIAVIRRPGYDSAAHAARAMGWLRRFVHPSSQARYWTDWSAPAILFLRLPPDTTSATAIRTRNPNWHERTNAPSARSYRFGSPMSPRRPLDRTSN